MALYSASVEYDIHCLLFLTGEKSDSRKPSVHILAELQGVLPELLIKVFTRLAKAGLVAATEGVHGGFRLAQPANEISVLDAVRAINGDKSIFECHEVHKRCAIFEDSPPSQATRNTYSIHAMILTAQKRIEEVLAQQIIPDLVCRVGHTASPEFGEEVLRWMGASWGGCGSPYGQPLAYMGRHRKPVSRKAPLSTVALVAPASPPALSPEAVAERPPARCNDP